MAHSAAEPLVIETPSAVFTYREYGSGPAFIVLHGGGPSATGMGNFSRNIDDFKDHYRVIVPDMPGFGESRIKKEADDGSDYQLLAARLFIEYLDALKIQKAHFLGNSLGGGIAIRLALLQPNRVDRLVLMGPYVRQFGHQFISPPHEGDAHLRFYYPNPSLDKMRALVTTFLSDPKNFQGLDELVQKRYELSLRPDIQEGFRRMSAAGTDPDKRTAWEKVASVEHKTLLLWGRDDKFCHLEYGLHFLAAMKNAELGVVRNTGHWMQLERPREFASYVNAFLTRA
jgi:pimeloyl-ACP methyl ester carboxylesterase